MTSAQRGSARAVLWPLTAASKDGGATSSVRRRVITTAELSLLRDAMATRQRAKSKGIAVGSKVRVKSGVTPKHNWGSARPGQVGVVLSITGTKVMIDWPTHPKWHGLLEELVLDSAVERSSVDSSTGDVAQTRAAFSKRVKAQYQTTLPSVVAKYDDIVAQLEAAAGSGAGAPAAPPLDAPAAVKLIARLFKGHDALVVGFNVWLPEDGPKVEFVADDGSAQLSGAAVAWEHEDGKGSAEWVVYSDAARAALEAAHAAGAPWVELADAPMGDERGVVALRFVECDASNGDDPVEVRRPLFFCLHLFFLLIYSFVCSSLFFC